MNDTGYEEIPRVCGPKYDPDNQVWGEFNLAGVLVVVCSYLVILIVGVVAHRVKTGRWKTLTSEEQLVGHRNIGVVIGVITTTASFIGGAAINGTAETIANPYITLAYSQLLWTIPVTYIVGAVFFAKTLRERKYVTVLDPFRDKYGRIVAGLIMQIILFITAVFYVAAILAALAATLSVIAGLNAVWSILISGVVVIFYTVIGGLYSVAYTDVIQFTFMVVGLWLCVPFALLNDAVTPIHETATMEGGWVGTLSADYSLGSWIDISLMLIFGLLPLQEYQQRVLSQTTPRGAQIMSVIAGFVCTSIMIPSVLIGAVAFSTDWNATDYAEYGCIPFLDSDYPLALPLVYRYLLPEAVTVIGLGAVSAAVMSSVDSSLLVTAGSLCRHVYAPIMDSVRPHFKSDRKVSDRESFYVVLVIIIIITVISSAVALKVDTVIGLLYLSDELLYCIMFPMLITVLYVKDSNSYGAFVAFWVGFILRLLSGEPYVSLPITIKYPWFNETTGLQQFPFRTLISVITFCTIILVSYLAKFLFVVCGLPKKFDVFQCFTEVSHDKQELEENENDNMKY